MKNSKPNKEAKENFWLHSRKIKVKFWIYLEFSV